MIPGVPRFLRRWFGKAETKPARDESLFKDQQPRSNPVITASFSGRASKGINGYRLRDRQEHARHVTQWQKKDRS